MSLKKMGKIKIGILFGGILILLLAGALFYYYFFYETPVEEWDQAEYSKAEDYLVQGNVVKNEKVGLSFVIPEGWSVDKEESQGHIALLSPDIVGRANRGKIEAGCEIIIEVKNISTNIDSLKDRIAFLHSTWDYPEQFLVTSISGHKSIKNMTGIQKLDLYGTGIHVPIRNILNQKLYYFGLSSNFKYKTFCEIEFDNFLQNIIIK